jgi:DNA repair/transcription protein MET18/MMS19
MPLLIRGLDLPDTEIRANVIDTLISAVGSDSLMYSGVFEHASSLVSTMLKNSVVSEMSSTVRHVLHLFRVNSTMIS